MKPIPFKHTPVLILDQDSQKGHVEVDFHACSSVRAELMKEN